MKNITLVEQMELSLQNRKTAAPRRRKRGRAEAASGWWFAQMRKVVDRAVDWQPRPTPPPLQEHLALGRCESKVTVTRGTDVRDIVAS